jgi:hypothetical protein
MKQRPRKVKQSTASLVREYAAAMGTFKKVECRQALGLTVDQVQGAVQTLEVQGYVRRISHGLYQACDVVREPVTPCQEKIWRAMKISPAFTVNEISQLTGAEASYIQQLFRRLKADGYIKPSGIKTPTTGGVEKVWRLTRAGKAQASDPGKKTFMPDPVVMAAVSLNRLICSGFAIRSALAAGAAMEHIRVIMEALKEVVDEK